MIYVVSANDIRYTFPGIRLDDASYGRRIIFIAVC